MEDRKLEEMEFHDQRERDAHELQPGEYERKYSNRKWYAITERSLTFIERWLGANVHGKTVLDYCCGLGSTSLRLAEAGATVHGIDISPESVATSRGMLVAAGLADRGHFQVMDAEKLEFEANKFDVIICFGVLHHLDVHRAFPELSRVLKPGGRILCGEALGYNPVIAAYRRLTPKLRTSWEAEHILTMKELAIAKQSFDYIHVHYFHLFGILATPLRRTPFFRPVLALLNWIDDIVLRIPGVQLMAWQMIFELREPKTNAEA